MAGPSTREANPRGNAAAGTSDFSSSVPAIFVLLLLGLALRLIIAYVLLPGSGFPSDLQSFQGWSSQLVAQTPLGFYDKAGFLDYPPVYLLFLWVLGVVYAPFGGLGDSIKLIPIFADLALAYLVFQMAQELGASRRRALIAATIVVINPITWFNRAIWGQADVVGAVFLLLGLRALLRDRRELAAAFAVVAALTKIQLGILGILVGFVVLRRSLAPREGERDPARVLTSMASGLATAALVCLPFTGLDLIGLAARLATPQGVVTLAAGLVAGLGVYLWVRRSELFPAATRELAAAAAGVATVVGFAAMAFASIASHIINTFGEYPFLTLNAYNPWALVGDSTGAAMDRTLSWLRDAPFTEKLQDGSLVTDPGYAIGPFSTRVLVAAICLILLAVGGAVGAWLWARSIDRRTEAKAAEAPGVEGTQEADWTGGRRGRSLPTWVPMELRAVAAGAIVVAAVVGCVLVGQVFRPLYAAIVGDGLLLAILIGVSVWAARRDDRLSIVVALAILTIAFFVVPTRAHERYLFPFFAVGAILLAVSWRWSVAYVVLALVNTANLLAVLVQYKGIPGVQGADGTPGPISGLFGDWGNFVKSAEWPAGIIWPIAVSGIVMGLALLWALTQMRTRAVQVLASESDRAGREPEPESAPAPVFAPAPQTAPEPQVELMAAGAFVSHYEDGRGMAADGAAADGAAAADDHAVDAVDADYEDEDAYVEPYDPTMDGEPEFVPAFVMRIWRWLYRPSVMPDRSASLATEPRGRIDKLDIWVVVALVVVILSMRVYRLDEPAGMHFDEVYHARTATEFLQDWRYGIRHDVGGVTIYEWTHPHLAKYAIAGGLVVFSDDKVTATSNLGVTVKDAVVQPRIVPSGPLQDASTTGGTTDARSNSDARLGDRLYVATGEAVNAYDLQTRKLEATYKIPGASTLSIAADTGDMYVGTSDGHIWRINVYSLDYVRLGTQAKPDPAFEMPAQIGFPIVHLYADSPPLILAVDATGKIVSVDGTGKIVGRGTVDGAVDFAPLATGSALVVRNPTSSASPTPDVSAEALAIATAVGLAQEDVAALLSAPNTSGLEQPLDLGTLTQDQLSALQKLIDDGKLPDISLRTDDPQVIVADSSGIGILDERFLTVTSTIYTGSIVRIPTSSPAPDVSAEAQALASALGIAPETVQAALSVPATPGVEQVLDFGALTQGRIAALQPLIDDGQLPDIRIKNNPATSIAINPNTSQQSYVAVGASMLLFQYTTSGSGSITHSADQTMKMPGEITKVVFDASNKIAQALGRTQDGTGWTVYAIESNGNAYFSDARLPFEPVVIGVDATPQLPNTDRQDLLALAPNGDMASVDIGQFAFAWRIVGVLFGTLMAVCLYLLARILFRRRSVGLLIALFSCVDGMLFAQSRIAMNDTYVGGFLLLAYLIFAFLWLGKKSSGKSWLAFWLGMPLLGLVLGLALASKWVALYAIVSIGVLILIRSAMGRLITILGLAAGTGILGWKAIAEMKPLPGTGNVAALLLVFGFALAILAFGAYYAMVRARTTPDRVLFVALAAVVSLPMMLWAMGFYPAASQNGSPNYTFFLILLAVTMMAAAVNAYHPIAWTRQELAFGIAVPLVIGILAVVVGVAKGSRPFVGIGAAGIVGPAAAFWVGGKLGFGPLALPPAADDPSSFAGPAAPPPEGWLRLGSGFGLPALWMTVCLMILPLAIYMALYIPWAVPWQQETADSGPLPVLMCWNTDANGQCTNAWPVGHTGQSLMDLTISMYNYHNDLRAVHAASSPWWAWPMDLKPVWFESDGYSPDLGAWIHDGGNPVLWWMAITGMAFICWQAFKRRSLGLALITIAFFWQWLSWARIDRASFQYHFYTALPFFLLGLAYFVAELWHGPSRRTWLLARIAAVGAAMFPAALWLEKYPLCGLARVGTSDIYGTSACGSVTGVVRIEARILLIALVLGAALLVLALTLIRVERRSSEESNRDRSWIFQLIVPVAAAGALLLWLGANGPRQVVFQAALPPDLLALVMAVLGICVGVFVISSRDSRRFALGLCVFAVIAFVALYPDLSALPLPNAILGVYDAILPTWFYGFQFSVNLQEAASVPLVSGTTVAVSVMVLFVAVLAGYWAWMRRVVNGYRRHLLVIAGAGDGDGGTAGTGDGGPSGDSDEPSGADAGADPAPAGDDGAGGATGAGGAATAGA